MDNDVGIDCGSEGQAGWRRVEGENWDNCDGVKNNKMYTHTRAYNKKEIRSFPHLARLSPKGILYVWHL